MEMTMGTAWGQNWGQPQQSSATLVLPENLELETILHLSLQFSQPTGRFKPYRHSDWPRHVYLLWNYAITRAQWMIMVRLQAYWFTLRHTLPQSAKSMSLPSSVTHLAVPPELVRSGSAALP